MTNLNFKEYLNYNPLTGIFIWIKKPGNRSPKLNTQAGSKDRYGYRQIKFNGTLYLEHRLAWLFTHGEFPKHNIDHINGIKSDNRLVNLRCATNTQNAQSSSTRRADGLKGTTRHGTRWVARISYNKQKIHIGVYDTQIEAHMAYCAKAKELFGEFFCIRKHAQTTTQIRRVK